MPNDTPVKSGSVHPAVKKAPVQPARKKKPAPKSVFQSLTSFLPAKYRRAILITVFDILMIGIGLLIFAYFHHVRSWSYDTSDAIVIERPLKSASAAQTPAPQASSQPDPVVSATVDPDDWGAKFAEHFTTGGAVEATENSYRSENIAITVEKHTATDEGGDPQVWFVADIYLRDIESYKTAFAEGEYGKGYKEMVQFIAYQNKGILAINGDYYGAREKGVVIRNGVVYRSDTFKDVCILYYDGVMETMPATDFNLDEAIARGAYQAFSFGPALLDENGVGKEEFDSEIIDPNPRTAIGYFEPGHYCFVVCDGRQDGYSEGPTLQELADIFEEMGCKAAYNLDGGESAYMVFRDYVISQPYDGGRKASDIVYIGEVSE